MFYCAKQRDLIREPVYRELEQQATRRAQQIDVETAVDRSSLVRMALIAATLFIAFGLYTAVSPKSPLRTLARLIAPWKSIDRPARVRISDVRPGATTVYSGRSLEVSARIDRVGDDEPVSLIYSTVDQQQVDQAVPMQFDRDSGRYLATLPRQTSTVSNATGGIRSHLDYQIEVGDAVAGPYRVTVSPRPSMVVERIEYDYPEYTQLPSETVSGVGDVKALEGTLVRIYAQANQQITSAYLEFDSAQAQGGQRRTVRMQHDGSSARVSFRLRLEDDRRTQIHRSYHLKFINEKDESNAEPILHRIDVDPDLAPIVEILQPETLVTDVPVNGTQVLEIRGLDPDFGLANIKLHGVARGKQLFTPRSLLTETTMGQVIRQLKFRPAKFGLREGEEVEIWATAYDNRFDVFNETKAPNFARETDRYKLRITAATKEAANREQGQPGQQGDEGQGDQDAEGQGGESSGSDQGTGDDNSDGNPGEGEPQDGDQSGGEEDDSSGSESGGEQSQQGEQGEGQEGDQGSDGGQGMGESGEGDSGEGEQGEQGAGQNGAGNTSGNDSSDGEQNDTGGTPSDTGDSSNSQASDSSTNASSSSNSKNKDGQRGPQQGQRNRNGNQQSPGDQDSAASAEDLPSDGSSDGDAFERVLDRMRELNGENDDGTPKTPESSSDGSNTDSNSSSQPRPGEENRNPGDESNDSSNSGQPQEGEQHNTAGEPANSSKQQSGDPTQRDAGESETSRESGGEQGEGKRGSESGGDTNEASSDQGAGESGSSSSGEQGSPNDAARDGQSGQSGQPETGGQPSGEGGAEEGGAGDDQQGSSPGGKQPGDSQPSSGQAGESEAAGDSGQPDAGESSPGDDGMQGDGSSGQENGEHGEPASSASPDGSAGEGESAGGSPGDDSSAGGDPSSSSGDPGPPGSDTSNPGNAGSDGVGEPQGGSEARQGDTPLPGEEDPPEPGGDDPNLEYARKATDLALEHLKDQESNPDPELLNRLGWNKDELQQFIKRWEEMQNEARQPLRGGEKQELDDALRSLGLYPVNDRMRRGGLEDDQVQGVRDAGVRSAPPTEYEGPYKEFMRRRGKRGSSPNRPRR